MSDSNSQGWVLDKRVPVAIIFGLVLQAMGAIWWAATMEGRVVALEARWAQQAMQSETIMSQDRRVTILEIKIDGLTQGIKELKNLIEKRYRDP
ncbi:hypothetical protein SAMN04515647_3793 [Cohaesibacter sp. ES.047]|uniref:hypothetical protein n=1 Tax=Cohaesibacter sp. ES.047 TaxID=1798205 RepID=UPI000BB6FD18|nr:hypothetical protein [Cohaesibacter sp. ES.047]SNY93496.1 hypothetical protein SAMN04515647_3793 [Cohaesibacter sp. ES.047]